MTWRTVAALLLAALTSFSAADLPTGDHDGDAWSLLVDHFEMAECSPDSPFAAIARRKAGYPDALHRAINRAQPWIAPVAAEIIKRGLPGELALLPMVESGYDVFAFSRREAAGSWQLLESTAMEHGLAVNDEYDGRRDKLASTAVALDYLETLHRRLDRHWELAIQAYNAGPTRIRRLLVAGNNDLSSEPPWLPVPGETRAHFNRLMGLACLLSQPARFGFQMPTIPMQPAIAVIELDRPVDLSLVAAGAEIDPAVLIHLNAGLTGLATPVNGPSRLIVPRDSASRARSVIDTQGAADTAREWPEQSIDAMRQRLEQLQDKLLPERHHYHQVRPGEDLWVLSQRYSVAVSTIRRINGLDTAGRVRPGQLIRIPPGTPSLLPHQYRVQPGDSLWSIARDHGMSVSELVDRNTLTADDPLLPGQIIIVADDSCCDHVFQALSP